MLGGPDGVQTPTVTRTRPGLILDGRQIAQCPIGRRVRPVQHHTDALVLNRQLLGGPNGPQPEMVEDAGGFEGRGVSVAMT